MPILDNDSYLAAALRGHTNATNMVAPDDSGPPPRDADLAKNAPVNLALVSTNSTAHKSDNPFKYWDGDKTTLAPFLSELDITLSAHDSALHTYAIEYYAMLTNGKTVISLPGQAAQLDGNTRRRDPPS